MSKKVLFIGAGNLGGQVVDLVSRFPGEHDLVVGGRNVDAVRKRVNLSRLVATQLGGRPRLSAERVDLWDIEGTAQTIADHRPDVIFAAVTLQSWWVISELPPLIFAQLDAAQVGPWLPMHLTLMHRLMRAVRTSGCAAAVVNASYPDVVNPVLACVGLAPTCGIGNVANAVPGTTWSVAAKLGVEPDRVQVRMVMHHYVSHRVSHAGDTGGAPFEVAILVDGTDVTEQVDRRSLFSLLPTTFRRPGGLAGMALTAASAAAVLRELMEDGPSRVVHSPGPNGLPGGYPVRFVDGVPEVVLPGGLSLEDAIGINVGGQRYDGIESISENGTVTFTPSAATVMEELLGCSCPPMPLDESEDRAEELSARYRDFAKKVGCAQ
jgi:hypothetical protein